MSTTSTTFSNYDTKTLRKFGSQNGMVYNPQTGGFERLNDEGTGITSVDVSPEEIDEWSNQRSENKTQIGNTLSGMFDSASNMMEASKKGADKSKLTNNLNIAYSAISDVAMAVFPMAGAIMKAGEFATKALDAMGVGTDQMTTKDAVLDSSFFKLTPVGLANAIGAKKAKDFSTDQDIAERVGASYTGTESSFQKMEDYAGKKYGMFSNKERKKINKKIDKFNLMQSKMGQIADEADDEREYAENMGQQFALNYQNQLNGGFNPYSLARYQEGGAIFDETDDEEYVPTFRYYLEELSGDMKKIFVPQITKFIPEIISQGNGGVLGVSFIPELVYPYREEIEAQYLKSGGKVLEQLDAIEVEESPQKNLIPEGSMHRALNHLDNVEGITKKGIPVLDNNNDQQAEIESNEIIFRYEISKILEDLCAKYYSLMTPDEDKINIALEAGKLLTKEIMLNTDDRTGLIKALQKGGKTPENKEKDSKEKKAKEDEDVVVVTRERKPLYEKWSVGIPAEWLQNYDLETAYRLLPMEKLDRWKEKVINIATHPEEFVDDLDFHLPSVIYDPETGMYPFMKLGYDVFENPELWFEFYDYLYGIDMCETPEERADAIDFRNNYIPEYNINENRWYYIKRSSSQNDNGHIKYMIERVMGDPNHPPKGYRITGQRNL